ncbi:hypothetical protein [Amycolatopsis thermophila]|uniref:Holin n=1 Tax=Amycolatopsis thermophila TaxID=206084 RepID=A0ABU0ERQ1_9PSEU|nr:hypothetical protein [Amycolatopsis thermophila]MDQ0377957.1 hypothetical protein [Amycolatopsis thermophila]
MSDKLTSIIRTVVPGAWATLVAWLVSLGLPAFVTDWLTGLGGKVTSLVALAAVYAFVRWVEPRLPAWLTTLLLGSAKPPTYAPQNPDGSVTIPQDPKPPADGLRFAPGETFE